MFVYKLSLSTLETVLVQPVGGPLNGEPQTPQPGCISNAAIPSYKLSLSAG